MLGTRFIEDDRRIALKVPRVDNHARLTPAMAKKVVAIDSAGAIYFDNQPVTLRQLSERISAARQRDAKLGVIVRGDSQAPFQLVASVLSACKEGGVTDLSISVQVANAGQSHGRR